MLSALFGSAEDHPDAIQVSGRRFSREQLLAAATATAENIYGAGIVAIDATPTAETVVGLVAGVLAGVPVVPIPVDVGVPERTRILRETGASLRLLGGCDSDDRGSAPAMPIDIDRRSSASLPPVSPAPEDTAFILHSRGITGPPKPIRISRRAVLAEIDSLAEAWGWTSEDRVVHGLPPSSPHGLVLGILGSLRIGSRLTHTGRPRVDAHAAARGTLYLGGPRLWEQVCACPAYAPAFRSARLLVSGNAPLSLSRFLQLARLTGHRPLQHYGTAETLVVVSDREHGDRRPGSVGTPVSAASTRLVSDTGDVLPTDGSSVGELQIRGATLFSGYGLAPSGNRLDADEWFPTGDIATIGEDGRHRILGRTTDLIRSGAYRISAVEVKNALLTHPDIREAAVVGTPHPELGQQVTAYVVAAGVTRQQIVDLIARTLSSHKRPRRIHLVERLPPAFRA